MIKIITNKYWKMYAEVLSVVLFCCLLSVNSYNLNGKLAGTELAEAENNEPVKKERSVLLDFMTDVLDKLDDLQKQIDRLAGKDKLKLCPDGWLKHGSSCYFFSRDKATWFESLTACKGFLGYLAEINDHSENEYLKGRVRDLKDYFWVGGTDMIKENHWIWITSQTPITTSLFFDWQGNLPDNLRQQQHCMDLRDYLPGWNDYNCASKQKFICERNLKKRH